MRKLDVMTIGEVAELFGASRKYIKRYDVLLGMNPLRTCGGHRRYLTDEVRRALRTWKHSNQVDAVLKIATKQVVK